MVLYTPLARIPPLNPDWLAQLQRSATVSALQKIINEDDALGRYVNSPIPRLDRQPNGTMIYVCSPGIPDTTAVTPSTPVLPTIGQCCSFVQVAFTSSASYDTALVAMTNLGMRLANPCHENDFPPPPVGQEANFAATHTLTLSTTPGASTLWRSQLSATPGVSKVTAVGASYCVP